MERMTLRVEGMVCGHCEIAVQTAVRKLPGIKKVKANRRKREVVTEFDTALVTADAIVGAINGTGYQVLLSHGA
ncbi:MAG: copper ion binding protein [Clostridium sp.]|jgi:copper ion binding protein|nr:copper ion binding protein [Clostridium sp.]